MSSKKDLRRKRREQEQEQKQARRKLNPALMFIVGITLTLGLVVGAYLMFGERGGSGDPPWPGAVWSSAHGHWH